MAHSQHTMSKLEKLLGEAVRMDEPALAQSYLALGEELLEIEDVASARASRALLAALNAIGAVKFPATWTNARDNAGLDQTQSA